MSEQLTVPIDAELVQRWGTLREFVAYRAQVAHKHLKVQAADMDMAPSTLSRKLNPADGDTQRLNVDDLEAWLASTGEAALIVSWLASRYLDSDGARTARLAARAEELMSELARVLPALKGAAD